MKSLCSQNTALLNAKECCRWTTSVFMYPKLPAQRAIWTAFYCLFARVCIKRARWYWQTNKDLLDKNECGDPKDQSMKQRWLFQYERILAIIAYRNNENKEEPGGVRLLSRGETYQVCYVSKKESISIYIYHSIA